MLVRCLITFCLALTFSAALPKSTYATVRPVVSDLLTRHRGLGTNEAAAGALSDSGFASMEHASESNVPDDRYWKNDLSPSIPGLNGPVNAMTEFDNELVVAGRFTIAGSTKASSIAAWNGVTWRSLCDTIVGGSSGSIEALTVWNGKLIAGGYFTYIGGASVRYLAQWDGISWAPLSVGAGEPDGYVFSLAVYQNKLIVGGDFFGPQYTSGIASFDGQTWMSLGSSDPTKMHAIEVLLVHDNLLWAGGFTRINPTVAYLECWNGTNWSKPTGSLTGGYMTILALAFYQGDLYVGGSFSSAGSVPAAELARYDGTDWHALTAQPNGIVYSLMEYKGRLFASGEFTAIGSDTVHHVAAWDGTSWDTRDPNFNGTIYDLCVFQDKLFAGGGSTRVESEFMPAWRIAQWDSLDWSPLVYGMSGEAKTMIAHDGNLVIGGAISLPGSGEAHSLVRWDGIDWNALNSEPQGTVNCLGHFEGQLIAGGTFTGADSVSSECVLRFDGSTWSELGNGLSGLVRSIAVYRETLYVGGVLTLNGQSNAVGVVRWDGANWSNVGNWTLREVYKLAVCYDKLWVGGRFFKNIGDSANYLASWDGNQWNAPASLNGAVFALFPYQGKLVVGGSFTSSGSTTLNRVALLDDTTWAPFHSGFSGPVYCFAEHAGRLVAAGNMAYAIHQTTILHGIGAWNGTYWVPLGSGGNGSINAMLPRDSDMVVVGGFTAIGGEAASIVARWTKGCCDGVVGNVNQSVDDLIDLSDLSMFITYLSEPGAISIGCVQEGDINGGGIDLTDLSLMIGYLTSRPRPALPFCP